jgi:site-specific recombinase XerD
MGDWLVRAGYWRSNPLKWLQGPKLSPYARSPQRLDKEGMKQLWEGAASSRTSFGRHQWLTILALLYGLGLRRGEVARLNVADWNFTEGTLLVDGRKTGRERRLATADLVYYCLESYLPQRQNHLASLGLVEEEALFVGRSGGRLSGGAISQGIHRISRRVEVSLTSLHQFRHTCASDLLEAGVRLPEVQRMLGHQVISTTVRYLHLSDPQRRTAINLHPMNNWLTGVA